MDYVIKIMAPAERNYCYTDSQQLDKQTGCIGHLRGDMDLSLIHIDVYKRQGLLLLLQWVLA